MSVLKRRDGGWRIDIVIRRGKQKIRVKRAAKGARNRADALEMERALRQELSGRPDPSARAPLFEDFARDFVEKYAETNNKPSEVDSKRSILDDHLTPWFSGTQLDDIHDEDIEAYKAAKLKLGLKPKTINNHLAVLSKLYGVAREWKRVGFAPRMKRLRVAEPEIVFLSFDESAQLQAVDAPFAPMIRFALHTGLRQGELLGLRWSDVHPDRIVVRQSIVRGRIGTPKSHKSREVPLNATARAALDARPRSGELVFANSDGGYFTKGECKWPLWSACQAAGVKRVGWHALRHTFASHLVMRGVPLKTVQELLGHADIRMTMRYAHLSPDVKVDAVRLLEQTPGDRLGTDDGKDEPK